MCLCASVSQERDMQNRYETRSVVCVKHACTSETRFSFFHQISSFSFLIEPKKEKKKRRSGSALPFVQLVSRAGFTSPSVSNKSVMPARLHRRVFFFPAKEYSTMPASGREPSPIGPAQSLERPSNSFVASATETWSRELVLLGRMPTSTANFTIVRARSSCSENLATILAYILFPPSLKVAEQIFFGDCLQLLESSPRRRIGTGTNYIEELDVAHVFCMSL